MRELEQSGQQVNSLEGEGFKEAFVESSLFRTVVARESARWAADGHSSAALLRTLRYAPPAPHEIFTEPEYSRLDNSMLILAERGIDKDGDTSITADSMDAYGRFLDGDGPSNGKIFAASPRFTEYMREVAHNGPLGPYFPRVLEGVTTGDEQIIRFVDTNVDNLALFDKTNTWFRERIGIQDNDGTAKVTVLGGSSDRIIERVSEHVADALFNIDGGAESKKELINAYKRFTQLANQLFGIAFDTSSPSPWREFVMQNFTTIAIFASEVGDPKDYFPNKQFKRIEKLYPAIVDKALDTTFLPIYVMASERLMGRIRRSNIDKEILRGDPQRAVNIVEFMVRWADVTAQLSAGEGDKKLEDYDRFAIMQDGINLYLSGQITQDELLSFPERWLTIDSTLTSFPDYVANRIIDVMQDPDVDDDSPKERIRIEFLFDLFTEGELVTKIIEAGLPPTRMIKNLLRGEERKLAVVTNFNRRVLAYATDFPLRYITDWSRHYLEEYLDEEALEDATQRIESVFDAGLAFCDRNEMSVNTRYIILDQILEMYSWPRTIETSREAARLLSQDILPTQKLIDYVKTHPESDLDELRALKDLTRRGFFDPNNELQKELEYFDYVASIEGTRADHNYVYFEGCRYEPIVNNDITPLNAKEKMEVEAAASENANLYWFIAQRAQANRRLVVIGNESWGAYFITDPLRPHLEELGALVSSYKVRIASHTNVDQNRGLLTSIQAYLDTVKPDDIMIVDGTKTFFNEGKPRVSSAMLPYWDWFKQSGQYVMSFWFPVIPEGLKKVYIGEHLADYKAPTGEKPQVIFANPVTDAKHFPDFPEHLTEHNPAYFDDIHGDAKSEIVFTPKGIQRITNGHTKDQLIDLIQVHMQRVLPNMIRRTNPLRVS